MPTINVPGIGDVYAEGFAEEQTMQRILAAIQGTSTGTGAASVQTSTTNRALNQLGASAQKAGGNLQSGSNSAYQAMINAGTAADSFAARISRSSNRLIASFSSAGEGPFALAQKLTATIADMASSSKVAGAAFGALGGAIVEDLTGDISLLGPIIGAAVGGLAPDLVTKATSAVAGFIFEKLNSTAQAFQAVQSGGAILGGSLLDFRLSAHASNLTMNEFANVMKSNSDAMSYFGGQTSRGAREFARANQRIGELHGTEMRQLGFSFEAMGTETAQMMERFAIAGMSIDQLGIRTREVAAATFEQAKTTKVLAALNGRSIEQQKDAQQQVRRDAQAQAVIARLPMQMQARISDVISAFPHMRDAILDQVQFGRATSAEAMRQASLMPTAFAAVTGGIDQIKGGALSTEAALGSYIEMAKNSAAMREEYLNLTDVAALSRFTTNAYVKSAEQSVLPAQKLMATSINGTVVSVVDDMAKAERGVDATTEGLFRQITANRDLQIQLGTTTTGLLKSTDSIIGKVADLTTLAADAVSQLNSAMGVPGTTNVGGANTEVAVQRMNAVATAAAQAREEAEAARRAAANAQAPGAEATTVGIGAGNSNTFVAAAQAQEAAEASRRAAANAQAPGAEATTVGIGAGNSNTLASIDASLKSIVKQNDKSNSYLGNVIGALGI